MWAEGLIIKENTLKQSLTINLLHYMSHLVTKYFGDYITESGKLLTSSTLLLTK